MSAAPVAVERESFVMLQLSGRRFALPSGIVTELAPPVRLHVFPHQTPMVAGVIVRRGRIVPVYDVTPTLLGKRTPGRRFFLVATRKFEVQDELSAIPVDGECELITAEMLPSPEDSPKYVAGVLALGETVIEVLDFEKLVCTQTDAAQPPVAPSSNKPPVREAQS
ncbi:MAG: chemotaxis protein CheW [Candidatus Acidiferrales bacterium]